MAGRRATAGVKGTGTIPPGPCAPTFTLQNWVPKLNNVCADWPGPQGAAGDKGPTGPGLDDGLDLFIGTTPMAHQSTVYTQELVPQFGGAGNVTDDGAATLTFVRSGTYFILVNYEARNLMATVTDYCLLGRLYLGGSAAFPNGQTSVTFGRQNTGVHPNGVRSEDTFTTLVQVSAGATMLLRSSWYNFSSSGSNGNSVAFQVHCVRVCT